MRWPEVRKKENYGDSGDGARDAGGDDGDGAKILLSFILIYHQEDICFHHNICSTLNCSYFLFGSYCYPYTAQ